MLEEIKLTRLTCNQCGHSWIPRVADVRACPKCRSLRWDKPLRCTRGGNCVKLGVSPERVQIQQ